MKELKEVSVKWKKKLTFSHVSLTALSVMLSFIKNWWAPHTRVLSVLLTRKWCHLYIIRWVGILMFEETIETMGYWLTASSVALLSLINLVRSDKHHCGCYHSSAWCLRPIPFSLLTAYSRWLIWIQVSTLKCSMSPAVAMSGHVLTTPIRLIW